MWTRGEILSLAYKRHKNHKKLKSVRVPHHTSSAMTSYLAPISREIMGGVLDHLSLRDGPHYSNRRITPEDPRCGSRVMS